MKAVVWHGVGDIRLDEVDDPRIQQPTDAVIRITRSAICGTDLHMVKPTSAIDAYRSFDLREDGWLKTVLDVA